MLYIHGVINQSRIPFKDIGFNFYHKFRGSGLLNGKVIAVIPSGDWHHVFNDGVKHKYSII